MAKKQNDSPRPNLAYLVDKTNRGMPKPQLTDRDWLVSSTVMQWLGSPVGQCFLVGMLSKPEGRAFREHLKDTMKDKR